MNIEEKLTTSIISAIKTLYGQDVPGKMVQLQKTKKEFEGHLTLVVFPFLKMSKKGPEQTAQEIGGYLKEHAPELVSAYNAVKGFLNLTIASDCWIELFWSDNFITLFPGDEKVITARVAVSDAGDTPPVFFRAR